MDLPVYSRRWEHADNLSVAITATGWQIHHIAIGGDCAPTGQPYLFQNLDHDSINYPAALGDYMEYLWREAKSNNMTDVQIQPHLTAIGNWISTVEQASLGGLWASFK